VPQPVTIYNIAEKLGLTASTVSRALRNHPDISKATKKQVQDAAKKMKYKHNVAASTLRTGSTKTIGVVVPQINNYFFSSVISGIEEVAQEHRFNIIICQTNEDFEKEVQSVRTLIQQNVAAIFISLSKATQHNRHLKEAVSHKIPVVQFDRTDCTLKGLKVLNDNLSASIAAVRHLAGQGYSRIAFLAGPKHVNIFQERFEGYKQGIKENGFGYRKEWVAFDCLTKEKAKEALLKIWKLPARPDAILVSADLAAVGVLDAAKELGIKVPQQLGLCGFSNEPYTQWTSPSITSINQFSSEIGRKCMELFLEQKNAEKKLREKTIMIQPELVVRESSVRVP
jgi:LacI family transcriptional regulator, repressor for deo operon, udp, cdd, tsx, nupC, and nupG